MFATEGAGSYRMGKGRILAVVPSMTRSGSTSSSEWHFWRMPMTHCCSAGASSLSILSSATLGPDSADLKSIREKSRSCVRATHFLERACLQISVSQAEPDPIADQWTAGMPARSRISTHSGLRLMSMRSLTPAGRWTVRRLAMQRTPGTRRCRLAPGLGRPKGFVSGVMCSEQAQHIAGGDTHSPDARMP